MDNRVLKIICATFWGKAIDKIDKATFDELIHHAIARTIV